VTNILKVNESLAEANRARFDADGVFVVNLMSSPGSGKTSILERAIPLLQEQAAVAVIEGDIDTTRDADRIAATGAEAVQINTQGGCHLDANMVAAAAAELDLDRIDILLVENVGNLVCPAGFDLGEHLRVAVLSVTEGTDKAIKYPAMFRGCRALLVNKTDLLPYTDFAMERLHQDLLGVNPDMMVFPMSARTGEGIAAWAHWLLEQAGQTRR